MRSAMRTLLGLAAAAAALSPALARAAGKSEGGRTPSQAERRITPSENYVPVFGLATTLTDRAHAVGILMVDAGLDVPDAALRQRLHTMAPRLRDAMRVAMAEYASLYHRPGDAPDADAVARLMQRRVDAAFGAGAKVLLANMMVQAR